MDFKYRQTVLDASDIDAEAAFWAGLLDGTISPGSDRWRNVWIDSNWQLAIQLAEDHLPPTWPDKAVPQQIHFDLYVEGAAAVGPVAAKIIELGGRVARPAPDRSTPRGIDVFASPAGHLVCICWLPREDQ
ncbi:glyoxalase [Microlunatus endophyticus]|uniref:Glyoxalase n=1 Tax=Microlunatus endophyticus TaxID=1716077 RepID=A0A917S5Z5_9ACTN|nr:VOC family protein [Microlunatus endophyticus]GGL58453.1 glyoxalase [Microlunatus endophyticus]